MRAGDLLQELEQSQGALLAHQRLWGESLEPPIPRYPARKRVALGYLDHLHPFIREGCGRLLQDGHYAQAIEEAARAVFQYLRNMTGLASDGANLAEAAFSLKSPILAFGNLSDENVRNEQPGFMEMLKGLAKGVRNPLAHTHGRKEEFQKAFEYLTFASLLSESGAVRKRQPVSLSGVRNTRVRST